MGNAGSAKLIRSHRRSNFKDESSSKRKGLLRHCHVISTQDQWKDVKECSATVEEISPMHKRKMASMVDQQKIETFRLCQEMEQATLKENDENTKIAEDEDTVSEQFKNCENSSNTSNMADELTVEALQLQVQKLKQRLLEKDEVIRSLEKQLSIMHHEKDLQVSGLKESVDMVIREKDSEIRRLKAMWSPNEALLADLVPASMIHDVSNATNLLNAPELGSGNQNARFGISAENRQSSSRNLLRNVTEGQPKSKSQVEFIRKALQQNVFLKVLDSNQMSQLIDCMTQQVYSSGANVITEGEYGSHLYVLENGKVEVFHSKGSEYSEHVVDLKSGAIFGELAILYNCRRTASVRAESEVVLWCLDRKDFQAIVKESGQSKQNEYLRLLRTVEKLKSLPDNKLMRIADCLEESVFSKGEYIIRQGDTGDTFYIIQDGKVKVTHSKDVVQNKKKKIHTEEPVCSLEKGQYFGESALLTEENRSANVIVESQNVSVLMLDRQAFNSLVGSIADVNRGSQQANDAPDGIELPSLNQLSILQEENEEEEYDDDEDEVDGAAMSEPLAVTTRLSRSVATTIKLTPLDKLKTVRILGQGGFGCVKLVTIPGLSRHAFALKSIRKAKIIKTGQHQHVLAEKNILMEMRSPFVGKLHRTYKDDYKIYFLMDAYLGGDVYGILKKVGSLTDPVARFYAACVLEALEYLHLRGIIYRDLKPENLMLDHTGYVKLVDFGFAKRLRFGYKTYTFCGTPEYFPPEIIANKGHDFAADYWSYGVLIYELLTRNTPFYARDDMTVYENILNGIERVKFSKRVSKHAEVLIRSLCRLEPRYRLGYQRGGISDIRKQRWFQGFDWMGLKDQRIPPPFDPDVKNPTDTKHFEKIDEESFDKKEDKKLLREANLIWADTF